MIVDESAPRRIDIRFSAETCCRRKIKMTLRKKERKRGHFSLKLFCPLYDDRISYRLLLLEMFLKFFIYRIFD